MGACRLLQGHTTAEGNATQNEELLKRRRRPHLNCEKPVSGGTDQEGRLYVCNAAGGVSQADGASIAPALNRTLPYLQQYGMARMQGFLGAVCGARKARIEWRI